MPAAHGDAVALGVPAGQPYPAGHTIGLVTPTPHQYLAGHGRQDAAPVDG